MSFVQDTDKGDSGADTDQQDGGAGQNALPPLRREKRIPAEQLAANANQRQQSQQHGKSGQGRYRVPLAGFGQLPDLRRQECRNEKSQEKL